jgi:hypothetical protein
MSAQFPRLPDWRTRLAAHIAAHARVAFRPGVHDCRLFAAGGREAMTGVDVAARFRGCYSTVEQGVKLARSHGYSDDLAPVVEGLEEIAPIYAQVGDLAALDGLDGIDAMGIVQGEMIHVLHPRGAGLVPLTDAKRAWRV